jgi:ABC-type glycerol-3-phosphate transport system permease component
MAVAFTDPAKLTDTFFIFPKSPTVKNFSTAVVLSDATMGLSILRMFLNSIIVTSVAIAFALIISSTSAFGFSNYTFKAKEILFVLILLIMMIPIQTYIIPLFLLIKRMKLLNNYLGLIFPYTTIGLPLTVLLFRGFFEEIPKALKDAAQLDGASDLYYFLKIVIPMSRPVIATVIIFLFLTFWNEFLLALVLIQKDSIQTIPLAMSRLTTGRAQTPPPIYSAFITMTIVPIMIVFGIFQKWFVKGISAGSLKG